MKYFLTLTIILTSLNFSFSQERHSILQLKNDLKREIKEDAPNLINPNLSPAETKSAALAILYSVLLPGMGELYADSYSSGKYFTIAEGALWGIYFGMNTYANWQQDRYKSFAETNAGINPDGKDEDYFAVISEYLDVEQYNDEQALRRDFNELYDEEKFFWKWNSTEERREYREMWKSSEQTFNDLRFVVGAMIVNRIVSAINAARMVSSYNNRIEEELSWNISVGLDSKPNLPTSLTLNFTTGF